MNLVGSKRAEMSLALGIACSCCVGAIAQTPGNQNNPSKSFGPESCGRVDPAYIHTANETGGIPMFLQRSEAGKAFQMVRESTRQNVATVLWASAPLEDKPQVFEIPVDSVTQRITFAFSMDTKGEKLVLKAPNGQEIGPGSAHTEDTELNCGRIITVAPPAPGKWRAEVTGAGTFWLEAEAQSEIYFIRAEFVKLGGRIGHEGLFRIQGQPLAGTTGTLQASISAKETKTAEFYLVTPRGDTLKRLSMKPDNTDREFLEFTGSVELPVVPFRVAVRGLDSHAKEYQRFDAPLFHAESVEVTPKLNFDELAAGVTKRAVFAVKNLGAPRTFKVTVTDARRFMTGVEPKELSLGTGQTASVRVDLAVPAGTRAGVGDDLVIVVASTTGAATSNSSVVHLDVVAPGKN
jgi:von Willebrand factor A domain-containing protein 7